MLACYMGKSREVGLVALPLAKCAFFPEDDDFCQVCMHLKEKVQTKEQHFLLTFQITESHCLFFYIECELEYEALSILKQFLLTCDAVVLVVERGIHSLPGFLDQFTPDYHSRPS